MTGRVRKILNPIETFGNKDSGFVSVIKFKREIG